jgi:hypothetical protein
MPRGSGLKKRGLPGGGAVVTLLFNGPGRLAPTCSGTWAMVPASSCDAPISASWRVAVSAAGGEEVEKLWRGVKLHWQISGFL